MRVRRFVATLTAAAAVTACSSGPGRATAPPSHEAEPSIAASAPDVEHPNSQGFAIGDRWFGLPPEAMVRQASLARAVGANALRFDADANRIHPNRNGFEKSDTYNWAEFDTIAKTSRLVGNSVITVAYMPEGARDAACVDDYACAPAWPEQGQEDPYGLFAGNIGEHIAGLKDDNGESLAHSVDYFEIWNEENNKIDPKRYAAMIVAASLEIRKHIPNARIAFGGMAPNADNADGHMTAADYLLAVNKEIRALGHNPRDIYNAVAFHPYGYPAKPDQPYNWNGMTQVEGDPRVSDVPNLYEAMRADGIADLDLVFSEYGAPTCGEDSMATESNQQWDHFTERSYVDFNLQNDMLVQFMHWKSKNGLRITGRFVHALTDKNSHSKDREDCFGVYKDNEQLKTPGFALNR